MRIYTAVFCLNSGIKIKLKINMGWKLVQRVLPAARLCNSHAVITNCPRLSVITRKMATAASVKLTFKDDLSQHTITMEQYNVMLMEAMGVRKQYKLVPISRDHLAEYLPKSQEELPSRTMKDSYIEGIIPLSSDIDLQEKYITFMGTVRLGRLLEDMDMFSVCVVHKHLFNPKVPDDKPSPYVVVTAFVDKIHFTDYKPLPNEDIRLKGHVSWVGRSSIEVTVWLEQKAFGIWNKITKAYFLLACRDPTNEQAAIVNPLRIETGDEKIAYDQAVERSEKRKELQKQSLTKVIPTSEEQSIVHDLYLKTIPASDLSLHKRVIPSDGVWMSQHTLSNLIFSHPENRNLHNKVFGGFIMRNALELSWGLSYLFTKHMPVLRSISNITFKFPISVNSMIRMRAYVVYSHMRYVQITVYVDSWDSNLSKTSTSNVFNFTYEVNGTVPEVYPNTYQEAMMYIDGKRHFSDIVDDHFDWIELNMKNKI